MDQDAPSQENTPLVEHLKTLLGSITSEIKTPLTVIRGYSDLLLAGKAGTLTIEQEECIQHIRRSSSYITRLTQQILLIQMFVLDEPRLHIELIALQETIDNVVRQYEHRYQEKQINVRAEYSSASVFIRSDARILRIVLEQLIHNAIEYTPPQGEIIVNINTDGENTQIAIKDTGEGVTEANSTLLFRKFTVLHDRSKQPSVGLGLYIAKQLLQEIQSDISYVQNIPQGSTFTITLRELK